MAQNLTTTFPDKTISEGKKDEEYHKKAVKAIMDNTIGHSSYPTIRERILISQHYFNGTQDEGAFDFITSGGTAKSSSSGKDGGDEYTLPAKWINYQDIRNRVELLIGELKKRGMEVDVRSVNREAKSKRLEFKKKAIARIKMRPDFEKLAKVSGVPLGLDDSIPWDEEELEYFMENDYKTTEELIIQTALEYNIEMYKWKYKRLHQFRDVLIAGMCFCRNEIRNGYPQFRLVKPENAVWDYNATDDFLSDSQYFGEIEYATVEDVVERYDVTEQQLKDLYKKYKDGKDELLWSGRRYQTTNGTSTTVFKPFTEDAASQRILVFRAEWLDIATKKVKVTVDPHGNEHIHILGDDDKDARLTSKEKENGGKIEDRRVVVVRHGALVGGDLLLDYGLAPNQPRDIDNPSETRLSYQCLVPNFVNYDVVSKVWELKELQDFKNILFYRIQFELSTSGRKGFIFNNKFLPEGYEFEDIVYASKAFGVVPLQMDGESMLPGERMMEPYDNSMSAAIGSYVQLAEVISQEMDNVSGINKARQGQALQSGREGYGVTQMQMMQSSTMTEKTFELFSQYEERVLQAHADLIKITWSGDRERFAPIVGDLGIDVIEEDFDVDLNDYGVFVRVNPPIMQNREKFENMVMQAVSGRELPPDIATAVLMEHDLKRAVQKFQKEMKKFRKEQQMMKMQELQAQGQSKAQEHQLETQGELAVEKLKGDYGLMEAKLKAEKDLEKTKLKEGMDGKKFALDKQMDALKLAREDTMSGSE